MILSYQNLEMVDCETCGKRTPYTGTKRCNLCWAVEGKLLDYLKSIKGRDFVAAALKDSQEHARLSTIAELEYNGYNGGPA
jgi:hypothetical protein